VRLTIRKDNKVVGVWVAKTKRGFNQKQKAEILKVRLAVGLIAKEAQ
jgi:hypothetical protein